MKKSSRQLGREEQARTEVGRTTISRTAAWLMISAFLALIAFVPLAQYASELTAFARGERSHPWPQYYDLFKNAGASVGPLFDEQYPFSARVVRANRGVLREMRAFENTIDDDLTIGRIVRPPAQYAMSRWLGAGNERTYCGRGDWLFYQPDVNYLLGPGFLEESWLAGRIASADEWIDPPQPDPLKAIARFHEQLAARGITLIVMPTPTKPSVHPEKLAAACDNNTAPLQNVSYNRFISELERKDVLVFDCAQALVDAASRNEQYLRTDTHWRPETVEQVAALLKKFIEEHAPLPPVPARSYARHNKIVRQLGDIAVMLKLPEWQTFYAPEQVEIRQVLAPDNTLWTPDASADILVLGDSFSNIYSQEALGWGEGAGLIEQLSFELGRPVDRIVQNDNAAYATRAMLARNLARGRDRLAAKRIVVYQFACRELTEGDWKLIDLTLGEPPPAMFVVPEPGAELLVRGTIKSASPVPRPGTVPYRDHIFSLHLVDIEHAKRPDGDGQAIVYMFSMTNNVRTRASGFRPDDTVKLKIRPWSDVADQYGGLNRSEPQDESLLLQEPCWGVEAQ